MNYYTGNDVYRRLEALADSRFVWVSGNSWVLIYGDDDSCAKAVAFVAGNSIRDGKSEGVERARKAYALAHNLAAETNLPFFSICYEDMIDEIDSVILNGNNISLEQLKNHFYSVGLPVKNGSAGKAINSQRSSAYHQWQRENLGSITVSDIDLTRLDGSLSRPIEIIELKRSFKNPGNWRPYRQDFPNFDLIVDVASRIGAQFTIGYNYHVKQPNYVDDASRMSLFEYPSVHGKAHHLGVFTFNQFVSGDYLNEKAQV